MADEAFGSEEFVDDQQPSTSSDKQSLRDPKQRALAGCAQQHRELLECLRKGDFLECSDLQKVFWDCYAEHRGVRGNKVSEWFSSFRIFGRKGPEEKQQHSGITGDNEGN